MGLLGLLCCAAIAFGGWQIYRQQAATNRPPEQKTATVVRGDIRSTVAATGTIAALNSVEISSRVTGLIREMRVGENQSVKAGQVLLVLDDSALNAQLDQYRAQLANYSAIYERSRKLSAAGAQALQQLETDRTNYLVAKANYDSMALQQEYYVIKSPIDGTVIGKPTPAGQTVAQGISTPQVIMTVADLTAMQIKVNVDETDIGKIRIGQAVSFTVDAYGEKAFGGVVREISKEATTTSNVVYYKVYVDVRGDEGLLYPGMTARAAIRIDERSNVLSLPLSALRDNNGKRSVEVLRDGKTQSVEIRTGLSDDSTVEVVDGLQEGDAVLLPTTKAKTTSSSGPLGPPPL